MQDSKSLDAAVLCIVYYLSVMTVTCYKGILESTDIYPVEPAKQLYTTFSKESLTVSKDNDSEITSVDNEVANDVFVSKLDSDSEPVSTKHSPLTNQRSSSLVPSTAADLSPATLKYQKSSSSVSSMAADLSEQLEATLAVIAPWFCHLFKKFKNLLCKTFVGSNGKPVLFDGKVFTT